jgi:hypothetical protein
VAYNAFASEAQATFTALVVANNLFSPGDPPPLRYVPIIEHRCGSAGTKVLRLTTWNRRKAGKGGICHRPCEYRRN